MEGSTGNSLRDYRDRHTGETILVCGCGSSLSSIESPERFVTIGVNDVGRLFDPDYLVVLNPRHQFTGDRFRYVENSRAKAIFSQLDLGISHSCQVRFRLGARAGTEMSDPEALPYTRNSPYLAVCLALYMGARRIGLAGVDFTDDHFFAQTGRHPLTGCLPQIDQEYANLLQSCTRKGVRFVNLSRESLLKSIPKQVFPDFARGELTCSEQDPHFAGRKVFFVNYRFLSCGAVFHDGLAHAANELALDWKAADWDDASLEKDIDVFRPDLVFVVHGRKFAARRSRIPEGCRTAVWLLDEPYETDDTAKFSPLFDTVFLNDASSLHRHRNAHHLPVCYDPAAHNYRPGEERPYAVGFVGGANARREEALSRLARKGLLSYVVGGPWRDPELNRLSLGANIPASHTAELYRTTRIVLNVFRSQHHYNSARIPATDLNPRIYEALACGALVISEHRTGLDSVCPDVPTFRTSDEMESLVAQFLNCPELYARVRRDCIRSIAPHTYRNRLSSALGAAFGNAKRTPSRTMLVSRHSELADWESDDACVESVAGGTVILKSPGTPGPGSERGLAGIARYENVSLEFEVSLRPDVEFVAKIHQTEKHNQLTNSYHLMCHGARGYIARHDCILKRVTLPVDKWVWVTFTYHDGWVVLRLDGVEMARKEDRLLPSGYCFLGAKKGEVRLRNIRVGSRVDRRRSRGPSYDLLLSPSESSTPLVSIVTTVYDRVDCLARCIRSVRALGFRNFEQIVVADRPPEDVLTRIVDVVRGSEGHPITLASLEARRNDWGISPAAAGLSMASGKYVSFLSDDNGYTPNHFGPLVTALENDSTLGFVYSSCQYDGRLTLNSPSPRPSQIDLGQPLFRRELFDRYLNGTLPFNEFSWDWRMIERFLQKGVRWKHLNEPSFIFRLARYPHLIPLIPEVRTA